MSATSAPATPATVPPRSHRTMFEAVSDLSAAESTLANAVSGVGGIQTLLTTLVNEKPVPGTLADALRQAALAFAAAFPSPPAGHGSHMADPSTAKPSFAGELVSAVRAVAGRPNAVTIGGTVKTEVEHVVRLAETPKLSPVVLLEILTPLFRLEQCLADLRIAEHRQAHEAALAGYGTAIGAFEEVMRAHRALKGLKPQMKALALKLTHEERDKVDAETRERISVVHTITASAVAAYAASLAP